MSPYWAADLAQVIFTMTGLSPLGEARFYGFWAGRGMGEGLGIRFGFAIAQFVR